MTTIDSSAATVAPVTRTRRQLWLAAIKPPMYTVAVTPIWVGTAVAWGERGSLNGGIFGAFLAAAIAIVAWLNISNDVFDAATGIDRHKAESIVNLTGNRDQMFWLSNFFLAVGIGGIAAIAYWLQDWVPIAIVLLCCFLGYTYQGPPFRLGYLGLGEPICFVTFGPLALTAAYYTQCRDYSLGNLWASIAIGIVTSIILFCSHFHQVADDVAAGKSSPVVKLGTERAARWLQYSCISIYVVIAIGIIGKILPVPAAACFSTIPIAKSLVDFVNLNHSNPAIVRTCKFIAVRLHFAFGWLLGIGCAVG